MVAGTREATFGEREAVSVDDLLGEISKVEDVLDGLGFDRSVLTQNTENSERQKAICAAYARLFNTPDGRMVLEDLCDNSVRRVVFFSTQGLPADQAYAMGCQREGINAFLFFILARMASGRDEQPPQRET